MSDTLHTTPPSAIGGSQNAQTQHYQHQSPPHSGTVSGNETLYTDTSQNKDENATTQQHNAALWGNPTQTIQNTSHLPPYGAFPNSTFQYVDESQHPTLSIVFSQHSTNGNNLSTQGIAANPTNNWDYEHLSQARDSGSGLNFLSIDPTLTVGGFRGGNGHTPTHRTSFNGFIDTGALLTPSHHHNSQHNNSTLNHGRHNNHINGSLTLYPDYDGLTPTHASQLGRISSNSISLQPFPSGHITQYNNNNNNIIPNGYHNGNGSIGLDGSSLGGHIVSDTVAPFPWALPQSSVGVVNGSTNASGNTGGTSQHNISTTLHTTTFPTTPSNGGGGMTSHNPFPLSHHHHHHEQMVHHSTTAFPGATGTLAQSAAAAGDDVLGLNLSRTYSSAHSTISTGGGHHHHHHPVGGNTTLGGLHLGSVQQSPYGQMLTLVSPSHASYTTTTTTTPTLATPNAPPGLSPTPQQMHHSPHSMLRGHGTTSGGGGNSSIQGGPPHHHSSRSVLSQQQQQQHTYLGHNSTATPPGLSTTLPLNPAAMTTTTAISGNNNNNNSGIIGIGGSTCSHIAHDDHTDGTTLSITAGSSSHLSINNHTIQSSSINGNNDNNTNNTNVNSDNNQNINSNSTANTINNNNNTYNNTTTQHIPLPRLHYTGSCSSSTSSASHLTSGGGRIAGSLAISEAGEIHFPSTPEYPINTNNSTAVAASSSGTHDHTLDSSPTTGSCTAPLRGPSSLGGEAGLIPLAHRHTISTPPVSSQLGIVNSMTPNNLVYDRYLQQQQQQQQHYQNQSSGSSTLHNNGITQHTLTNYNNNQSQYQQQQHQQQHIGNTTLNALTSNTLGHNNHGNNTTTTTTGTASFPLFISGITAPMDTELLAAQEALRLHQAHLYGSTGGTGTTGGVGGGANTLGGLADGLPVLSWTHSHHSGNFQRTPSMHQSLHQGLPGGLGLGTGGHHHQTTVLTSNTPSGYSSSGISHHHYQQQQQPLTAASINNNMALTQTTNLATAGIFTSQHMIQQHQQQQQQSSSNMIQNTNNQGNNNNSILPQLHYASSYHSQHLPLSTSHHMNNDSSGLGQLESNNNNNNNSSPSLAFGLGTGQNMYGLTNTPQGMNQLSASQQQQQQQSGHPLTFSGQQGNGSGPGAGYNDPLYGLSQSFLGLSLDNQNQQQQQQQQSSGYNTNGLNTALGFGLHTQNNNNSSIQGIVDHSSPSSRYDTNNNNNQQTNNNNTNNTNDPTNPSYHTTASLHDLVSSNQLMAACLTQFGARRIQSEIENIASSHPQLMQDIFHQLLPHIYHLSVHQFANYVIQKLIEKLPDAAAPSHINTNSNMPPGGGYANNTIPGISLASMITPLLPPVQLVTPPDQWNSVLSERFYKETMRVLESQPNRIDTTILSTCDTPWAGLNTHIHPPPLPSLPEISPQYYCFLMLRAFNFGAGLYGLSLDPFGCRVVQKLLDVFASAAVGSSNLFKQEAHTLLLQNIAPHFYTFSVHQHANHVIQKCIETIPYFLQHPIFLPLFHPDEVKTPRISLDILRQAILNQTSDGIPLINQQQQQQQNDGLNNSMTNDISSSSSQHDNTTTTTTTITDDNTQQSNQIYHNSQPRQRRHSQLISEFTILITHTFGCRVVQRIYTYGSIEQRSLLMSQMCIHIDLLLTDLFGNYALQHVLACGSVQDCNSLVRLLKGKVGYYSTHKCASNVVEKAFKCSDVLIRNDLLNEILIPYTDKTGNNPRPNNVPPDVECVLQSMVLHPYANYVVQSILSSITYEQRRQVLISIRSIPQHLKRTDHVKRILTKIEGKYPSSTMNAVATTSGGSIISSSVSSLLQQPPLPQQQQQQQQQQQLQGSLSNITGAGTSTATNSGQPVSCTISSPTQQQHHQTNTMSSATGVMLSSSSSSSTMNSQNNNNNNTAGISNTVAGGTGGGNYSNHKQHQHYGNNNNNTGNNNNNNNNHHHHYNHNNNSYHSGHNTQYYHNDHNNNNNNNNNGGNQRRPQTYHHSRGDSDSNIASYMYNNNNTNNNIPSSTHGGNVYHHHNNNNQQQQHHGIPPPPHIDQITGNDIMQQQQQQQQRHYNNNNNHSHQQQHHHNNNRYNNNTNSNQQNHHHHHHYNNLNNLNDTVSSPHQSQGQQQQYNNNNNKGMRHNRNNNHRQ